MGDVEDPPGQKEEATPLRPARHVLMRRSTRVFDREPKSGILASTANLCCSLAFSLLVIAVFNIISVVSIVIGIMYIKPEHCPAEPNIAPILIASGVLAILLSLLEGRGRFQEASKQESTTGENPGSAPEEQKGWFQWFMSFIRLAKLALFIYFCVIVYSLYSKVKFEPMSGPDFQGDDLYCNATLYLFSFWTITFVLASIGLALLLCCCFCCCVALCVAADA